MKKIYLVILNPYAYDGAMYKAEAIAKEASVPLNVVFFISEKSVCRMMNNLGENGWLSAASIRSLQNSMLEGYRGLADDVLDRVQRKLIDLELNILPVNEQPTVEPYLHRLVAEGAEQIIVAGSSDVQLKQDILPEQVIVAIA
ncbi:hypothetical protein Lepto7376_0186 [[Leptolyngbya] sp. PCC 7376]|uniref:hypothetical protein n=1 Tax=[Leptolyngbya] sp. PCC 7376 TaxID=111781 RepID=UPI00029ED316|nr:hypothetical protein [[Leptolyngbya] sp. PCC 7376]AFY36631.1 hypothetical protein Lepto7376_0186 [[Leptolyngbya] sp. PCC 7376]